MSQMSPRPTEIVGASAAPVRLAGRPVSTTTVVPPAGRVLLRNAVDAPARTTGRRPRLFLNVEDLSAESNPGAVYGVYLNLPARYDERVRDHHFVGTVSVFGIEGVRERRPKHEHVPGMRHTFDITRRARVLRRSGHLDVRGDVRVTFLLELPAPPPGFKGDADAILRELVDAAAATTITVGRVSLFAG
jgi:hypothetical protein